MDLYIHSPIRRHGVVISSLEGRDSSVGTATGYRLDGRGSIPGRARIFIFSTASRPALGAHPAFYPRGPGGKAAEA
jgi:hypothetical protein